MKASRGFTLIEVLVVIVVIALLVSISALNSDSDPRENFIKNESSRIKFFLESLTDEAILNSKNIAINFTRFGASPYQWQKAATQEEDSDIDTKEKWEWAPYTSSRTSDFQLQNEIEFKLFINNNEILLKTEIDKDNELVPQVIIQSSGIQTLVKINLSIDGYEKNITVKGNGAGRYKVGSLNNEFQ